jgi:hypothetical protein
MSLPNAVVNEVASGHSVLSPPSWHACRNRPRPPFFTGLHRPEIRNAAAAMNTDSSHEADEAPLALLLVIAVVVILPVWIAAL